jgi:Skp family chaperone for outer membrane proteins
MKDKLPNIIMEGKSPTIRIFNIRVLFSLDEERGYLLDTEEMRRQFEEKLSKLEDEVSELNETWQEKQKEYAEDIGPIYTL